MLFLPDEPDWGKDRLRFSLAGGMTARVDHSDPTPAVGLFFAQER
jgi:hypothetical protein